LKFYYFYFKKKDSDPISFYMDFSHHGRHYFNDPFVLAIRM